jgi:hypothetical protein
MHTFQVGVGPSSAMSLVFPTGLLNGPRADNDEGGAGDETFVEGQHRDGGATRGTKCMRSDNDDNFNKADRPCPLKRWRDVRWAMIMRQDKTNLNHRIKHRKAKKKGRRIERLYKSLMKKVNAFTISVAGCVV